ncbi:dihydrodipicolinate reductase [Alkalihalobacillus alcalophilus ATCC 27647 = CGMCC 1.3604]|uniref:4-hydroxy-tetrahydrodipicolinate reductase n=1 Tax=Alkalihalobacillus alcalophilus ATCC 27647 = CGMCC 1.3604 TaxID=1218173 RepID=A0A094WMX9_ALKAL|nr:4-hydroxy-tetrahydrodipicolinate reductase [Alkalihalobacillus alcalophilus]KGA99119.1 dihydrodipicolinate reductase [Alkalihalobacillus alcalophilus ATCC 27647 = CGMCC 1.3604]MED1563457.1 4-hydroxy-tetrahydrodipicolinate reductase [Alkalihalobacillus alcalophilus]THG90322.1 dihydrodipicolinate reductase [Alkalihalobacillus alcalophilus ATCC 27647 = CGMCC 1.3604]
MSQLKIVIAGHRGNMGKEAVKMVSNHKRFELVAVVDSKNTGKKIKDIEGLMPLDIPIYEDIDQCLSEQEPDVLIDLTNPKFGKKHMESAFNHGVRPVVGTTGFTEEDIAELRHLSESKQLGAIIAPNFAIGAILMMKFAETAAKYMPDVEIIERHHDRKLDAPSGTAIKTAQLITEVREAKTQGHPEEKEELQGARGADIEGMKIHSVRMPGLVAHQEVLFGSVGQTLTIRHDSINRESFMPGVQLAVETVMNLDTLVYGLENIID